MIDAGTFRDVMAQWPSGVTLVTTLAADGTPHGMTASSFSSVSLDPPLVSVCLATNLYSHELIRTSGVFGVSVLAKDQAELGRRFAGMVGAVADRFTGDDWHTAQTGAPVLESALGWVDCRVVHAYPGGDHTIFVGEVLAGRAAGKAAPLLFHSRGWGQFADVLPDVATLSDGGVVTGLSGRGGTAAEIAHVASVVVAAGVRVRVADLTDTASPREVAGRLSTRLPLSPASVLAADRAQVELALGAGVGVAELVVDPTDPAAVERTLAAIDGVAERTAVHLVDPFGVDRLDGVVGAVRTLARAGVGEIGLPDTAGSATPLQVRGLLQEVAPLARPVQLRMGLHDRDRLGLVKAITALKSGVRHFDTTLAGLDGAVATEDLIRLLEEVDVDTPVDTADLVALSREVRSRHVGAAGANGRPLPASPDATEIVGAAG